jgi:hypothetical protein
MTKRGPTPKREWQPMQRGVVTNREKAVAAFKEVTGREPGENDLVDETWLNDKYVVSVRRREDGSVANLSIRRQDRGWPRDWRDFQRIKNEIAGPEVEAVELYPAESRLVDTANQFWLWCLPVGQQWPFGFDQGRAVTDETAASKFGARQRRIRARKGGPQ